MRLSSRILCVSFPFSSLRKLTRCEKIGEPRRTRRPPLGSLSLRQDAPGRPSAPLPLFRAILRSMRSSSLLARRGAPFSSLRKLTRCEKIGEPRRTRTFHTRLKQFCYPAFQTESRSSRLLHIAMQIRLSHLRRISGVLIIVVEPSRSDKTGLGCGLSASPHFYRYYTAVSENTPDFPAISRIFIYSVSRVEPLFNKGRCSAG